MNAVLMQYVLQVLVHGCILSESNFEEVMESVRRELALIEMKIATSMKDVVPGFDEMSSVGEIAMDSVCCTI